MRRRKEVLPQTQEAEATYILNTEEKLKIENLSLQEELLRRNMRDLQNAKQFVGEGIRLRLGIPKGKFMTILADKVTVTDKPSQPTPQSVPPVPTSMPNEKGG